MKLITVAVPLAVSALLVSACGGKSSPSTSSPAARPSGGASSAAGRGQARQFPGASGLVAAVLVAATLVWGLLITTHLIDRRGLPAWLTDLHRGLGGLSVVFIGIHLGALVADSYLHFSWRELFVPFASTYESGAVAWGVVALWGIVAVEGSSLVVRRRKKSGWWRRIHYLSFPVGVLVGVHMLGAGLVWTATLAMLWSLRDRPAADPAPAVEPSAARTEPAESLRAG